MPARSYYSGRLHWCLTVSWAGRTFRWASSPLTVETASGETISFDDGLEPVDYEDSLQGLGVASLRSIPVEIHFPPEVDVAEWIALGHDLATATGEVSIWSEGTVWEERRVLLSGPVREPEYGSADEPVSFSVEDAVASDRSSLPPRSQVVTETTWPNLSEDAEFLAYPTVWGRPGVLHDTNGTCAGSPAPCVHYSTGSGLAVKILVAGHKTFAGSCIVFNDSGNSYSFSIDTETDGVGQTVSTIDLSVVSTGTFPREGSTYFVSWYNGPALVNTIGEAVETVGDLLVYLLDQSSITLDRPAWTSLDAQIGGLRIDGFVDETVSTWEWITDNLLPLLPLSILPGPDGYYPVIWRLGADRSEAVATISPDDDVLIERQGRLTYSKLSEVVNSLTFKHSIDLQEGSPRRTMAMSPSPDLDEGELGSYYCELSEGRYGVREEEVDSDIVWRAETATYVLARMVERSALPSREVSYSLPSSYGWLRLGDVVLVSDEEVHLDREIALIVGLRWVSEEEIEARLLLPARPELRANAS